MTMLDIDGMAWEYTLKLLREQLRVQDSGFCSKLRSDVVEAETSV